MQDALKKAPKRKMKLVIGLLAGFFFLILIVALSGGGDDSSTAQTTDTDFQTLSSERFEQLESDWKEQGDELDRIECLDDDCTSVVYFYFNTAPDDLDMVIRGNAATFSNFKLENTGTSHVSVFAVQDGVTLEQCDAAKGVVTECK